MPEEGRRRTSTAQYKLDVVAEYGAAATSEKDAVLRREGLYSRNNNEHDDLRAGERRRTRRRDEVTAAMLAL
jgi:hypothetical protein